MNRYRFDDSIDSKGKARHLHTLDGHPLFGTSTVLSILAKPLTWWASGLAVATLGWTDRNEKYVNGKGNIASRRAPMEPRIEAAGEALESIKYLTPAEYLDLLDTAYAAHSVKLDTSAEAGTDMHAELESFVKLCISGNDGKPVLDNSEHKAVELFSKWSVDNVKRFVASEAFCYSERLFTGGIVDVMYADLNGDYVLLDFKSAKDAYDAHYLQNAGYDIALSENGILTKEGDLVQTVDRPFVAYGVLPFGMAEPVPQFRTDVEELKQGFIDCVSLYRLLKGGKPSNG